MLNLKAQKKDNFVIFVTTDGNEENELFIRIQIIDTQTNTFQKQNESKAKQ